MRLRENIDCGGSAYTSRCGNTCSLDSGRSRSPPGEPCRDPAPPNAGCGGDGAQGEAGRMLVAPEGGSGEGGLALSPRRAATAPGRLGDRLKRRQGALQASDQTRRRDQLTTANSLQDRP